MSKGTSPRRSDRSGGPGLRVVIDTNVWVSGLILPQSVPGQVLHSVRRGLLQPVASWALAEELLDVLRRPKLRKYRIVAQDFGDLLAILAPFLPSVEVQLRDPDDVPAVAAAVAGRAGAIVTGDNDLPVRATSDRPAWSAHAP